MPFPVSLIGHRVHARAAAAALVAVGLALAACGGDEGAATPSPTSTGSAPATATAETTYEAIRDVPFADPAIAGDLLRRAGGGEVDPAMVQFGDIVPGSPGDEAVVVVHSGGTAGEIGAGVFRLRDGRPDLVAFLRYAGRVEVRRDLVVTVQGVYEAGDAQCCPSRLRETAYQWDGDALREVSDQTLPNPDR